MKAIQMLMIFLVAAVLSGKVNAQTTVKSSELKIKSSAVCGECKDRIEAGLAYEKGIKEVTVDLKTKEVTVKYNASKTTPAEIRTALSKLGYDADNVKADPKAYAKLPACCKKDATVH